VFAVGGFLFEFFEAAELFADDDAADLAADEAAENGADYESGEKPEICHIYIYYIMLMI